MSNSTCGRRRAETRVEGSGRKRKDGARTATSVTMELDVLDCPVCFEPLRPPIFQCAVGHLICSTCCGKLPKPKKCHHCSSESDYNRCHGIEKIIGSIRVPCSNTKYGCSMETSYYEREDHETTCPHAPCFSPDTSCSFSGSVGMLQEHFVAEHQWPSTKISFWKDNLYHAQSSEFQVPITTLSDGLPRDCFLFIVPKCYLDKDSKISVTLKKA